MDLMKSSGRSRGRSIALLVAGLLAGTVLLEPAVAHVTRRLGHLTRKHLDKRYYNEGQKVGDANTLDGLNSTAFLGATAKAADADELDGIDSTGFQESVHWAHVNSNGTIIAQSGGLSTTRNVVGEFYVHFPVTASGKAVLATGKWTASNGTVTSVFLCGGNPPEGTTCTQPGTNNPSTVYVDVKDDDGTLVDRGFYIVLFP
jgi:hypothetical protein